MVLLCLRLRFWSFNRETEEFWQFAAYKLWTDRCLSSYSCWGCWRSTLTDSRTGRKAELSSRWSRSWWWNRLWCRCCCCHKGLKDKSGLNVRQRVSQQSEESIVAQGENLRGDACCLKVELRRAGPQGTPELGLSDRRTCGPGRTLRTPSKPEHVLKRIQFPCELNDAEPQVTLMDETDHQSSKLDYQIDEAQRSPPLQLWQRCVKSKTFPANSQIQRMNGNDIVAPSYSM